MKTINVTLIAACALALFSGCATSHSPLEGANTSRVTGGSGATLATSTAIGAAAGAALVPEKNRIGGAAGGAALGLVTGALVTNHNKEKLAQAEAEAFERGRRQARLEVMSKYWHDNTLSPSTDAEGETPAGQKPVEYPPGVYEGINYGPRTSDTITPLKEPKR